MNLRLLISEPRGLTPVWVKLLIPILSVLAAGFVAGVFLYITGETPSTVYAHMLRSAFGSSRGWSETLISGMPLILTGLAAAVAFKMLVWNIGAEGQFLMGAIAGSGMAIWLGEGVAPGLALPLVVLAGCAGGAAWASASALPKVYLGTNEIITTLMLNFIALRLMEYLIFGSHSPWRDSGFSTFPSGRPLPEGARFPEFFNRLDIGVFIAAAAAAGAWYLLNQTRWGFEVRVVGDSENTARYAGIKVPGKILSVFLLSGAFAGLAGALFVAGPAGALDPRSLKPGPGFHRDHRGRPGPAQPAGGHPGGNSAGGS